MATYYSASQYDGAFTSSKLQNWNIPRPYKERPSTHDGFTQFITDNRGHLLPGVPRSKVSPWGTYIGTWDMPSRIPPCRVSLTSRSAGASRRLTEWIETSESLLNACNGLRPDITGKVPLKSKDKDPQRESRTPSQRSGRPSRSPQKSASPPGSHIGSCSSRHEGQRDADPGSARGSHQEE